MPPTAVVGRSLWRRRPRRPRGCWSGASLQIRHLRGVVVPATGARPVAVAGGGYGFSASGWWRTTVVEGWCSAGDLTWCWRSIAAARVAGASTMVANKRRSLGAIKKGDRSIAAAVVMEPPVLTLFAVASPTLHGEDGSWKKKFEDLLRGNPSPEVAAYHEEQRQEMFHRYISIVAPKLRAIVAEDSAKKFVDLHVGWSHFMGLRGSLYPEILCCMVSSNALRCAKAALEGGAPLGYCRADPNGRHRYGFTPLHMAAETFSVDMLNLLFRYGASANTPTKGDRVIENLLPLNVAVENASMHKYLEDHWDDGDPVHNLIFLLCLPEMKMFLDTVRLIAKHTDNIVDMVSKYIDGEKLVEAAILLLASQKQLRDSPNNSIAEVSQNGLDVARSHVGERLDTIHCEMLAMVKEGKNGKALKMLKAEREKFLDAHASCSSVKKAGEALLAAHEVSLNGFDIVKGRIDDALDALHHEELSMVKLGKNGKVLKMLKDRKEVFLTAHALVGIRKAGEVLERYIQSRPQVPHAEIVEHVSSILNSNGVVHFGKGIDTGNLECYQYRGQMLNSKPGSQSVEGRTNEADKSSPLKNEGSERILPKQPPRLVTKDARNMFFPYWKSVLSARLQVKITPPSQPSRKAMQSTEPSGTTTQSTVQLSFTSKSLEPPSWIPKHLLGRNNGSTRQFCAVASMSLKAFKRI